MAIEIRLFEARDAEQIARLFHETVREVNICDYSSNQVRAWAPDNLYFRNWVEVCSNRFTYVADDAGADRRVWRVRTEWSYRLLLLPQKLSTLRRRQTNLSGN